MMTLVVSFIGLLSLPLNVTMIFPIGEGNYSVMDMLGASGLVNYFGKVPNLDKLTFQPLLFQKGETFVSIYGIGSMNDDRLFRLFQEEKVVVRL